MQKMTLKTENLYLSYGYMSLPTKNVEGTVASKALLGTFLSNMAYYGYVPSTEVMSYLLSASADDLKALWKKLEAALKGNSGEGRDIGKHVVYKNFPKEVLEMSQAEYWIKQILMYIGLPNELFTQKEEPRDALFEDVTLKVLHAANDQTAYDIFHSLLTLPNRWTETQTDHSKYLLSLFGKGLAIKLDMDAIGFKENGINAIVYARANNIATNVSITTATDALRLAAGLSGADVSLRTDVKFKKFKRSERRFLLSLLEASKNLEDDIAARPDEFKKLFMVLHPGDYSFARVNAAYDKLYKGQAKSFAAKVDLSVISDLNLLSTRPGEFLRRFHAVYSIFQKEAVDVFVKLLPKLSTQQLVKFRKYLETINSRKQLVYPPRGNWNKLKIVQNEKKAIAKAHLDTLDAAIDAVLRTRLAEILPEGVALDISAEYVKLQTNDQKLASYGRGTAFPIPANIKFVRAASYWGDKNSFARGRNTWMDNGFNFFDEKWNPVGTICWNATSWGDAAAFSGDPTNSKTSDGKACQVIDLYLDKLQKRGVRYAVWNVLSYNNIPFDDVDDIFASLQWGEEADKGKIYEPSRAQMEFQITGQNKTKYIAYIDLFKRELVYMDANLKGEVQSATGNAHNLAAVMPAFVEYLESLPSVYDLFKSAPAGAVPVTFSDVDKEIAEGKAYVFRPENPDNKFTKLDLNAILS